MSQPTQIRGKGPTFRRHFLAEWLEEREMEPMDLLNELNEPSDMETPAIDKSQVYRWLKGQLPQRKTQVRIAAALNLVDPETGDPAPERLMTHPAQDWIAKKVSGLEQSDIERLRQMVDLAFPDKTGTDG